ncbi:hypothetical protein LCGC14_2937280, partial [marine sediment metagenome]
AHPHWTRIMNDHAAATAVLKLTGKSAVESLMFDLGTGNNGLIMTSPGATISHVHLVGSSLTGAGVCLWLDGDSVEHADLHHIEIEGNVTFTTGLLIDQFARAYIDAIRIFSCLTAIQIVGANSDENTFIRLDIGDCSLGLDLDAGNEQHFDDVLFNAL